MKFVIARNYDIEGIDGFAFGEVVKTTQTSITVTFLGAHDGTTIRFRESDYCQWGNQGGWQMGLNEFDTPAEAEKAMNRRIEEYEQVRRESAEKAIRAEQLKKEAKSNIASTQIIRYGEQIVIPQVEIGEYRFSIAVAPYAFSGGWTAVVTSDYRMYSHSIVKDKSVLYIADAAVAAALEEIRHLDIIRNM